MRRRGIPTETLMELRNSLDRLPKRSKERHILIEETAQLYGVSTVTIYRALKEYITPKSVLAF
jgi:hypothetical protein